VQIAVTVFRIKRFNRYRYQEIALSGVTSALASRRMTDAIGLMQGVGHVIGESGLFQNPLAVRLRERRLEKRQKQEGRPYCLVHN
jgi:hypothetical protein